MVQLLKLQQYFLCAKKIKNNVFIQLFLLFRVRLQHVHDITKMCVHSSASKQGAVHPGSTLTPAVSSTTRMRRGTVMNVSKTDRFMVEPLMSHGLF